MGILSVLVLAPATAGGRAEVDDPDYDNATIEAFIDAKAKGQGLSRQENPNWDEVVDEYDRAMPLVRVIDRKTGTRYEREIADALGKCAAGDNFVVNGQIVWKGMQHVTYLAIQNELDKMANGDADAYAKRVSMLFEGIRPTFQRRDRGYFPDAQTLEKAGDAALKALEDGDSAGFIAARRDLEAVMHRAFALSVFYEATGIAENHATDRQLAERKQMEAIMYYRIIEPVVMKRNPSGHQTISTMINASFDTVDPEVILSELQDGLGGAPLL